MTMNNNLSSLQQLITDKESELRRMRQIAADAAQHQEEEAREHLLQLLETAEQEVEHCRRESEFAVNDAIIQAERDAELIIEQTLQQKEKEIFQAAEAKMAEEWAKREENLRKEFEKVLSTELEEQQAQFKTILQEKEEITRATDDEIKLQLNKLEEQHQHQIEELHQKFEIVAEEIYQDACEKISVEADEKVSQSLAVADEQCQIRDEQISLLLEERTALQQSLDAKIDQLETKTQDLIKMEKTLKDSTSELSSRHDKEMSLLSEEATHIALDSEQLQLSLHAIESENELMNRDLVQCKREYKSLETKCSEQKELINTFDSEKQQYKSRINELSACKQLLERQLLDSKEENSELTMNSEQLKKKITGLTSSNEDMSSNISSLNNQINELKDKHHNLDKRYNDATAHINSLEQERRELEHRINQKDKLLSETVESLNNNSRSNKVNSDPVVVHLHNPKTSDNTNSFSGQERLSAECNNLRSKVLQLQRENFRLEKEGNGEGSSDVVAENNSLKTVVSMMRKEMEASITNNNETENIGKSSSDVLLQQQLIQCRSYLDLLLQKRDSSSSSGRLRCDETTFLRSKYEQLHRTADELREENERLHMMCNSNGLSRGNDYDYQLTSTREQELIQRLEEASDEIEALLRENERLMNTSNELRFELQRSKSRQSSSSLLRLPHRQRVDNTEATLHEHEQEVLDAILNDKSRSDENERHENSVNDVSCIVGRKSPLTTNMAESRVPSKTAYVSYSMMLSVNILLVYHLILTLTFSYNFYRDLDQLHPRIELQRVKRNHCREC